MMETGSGETARTASLLKEKLLQRAPEHGKYPMDIEGLVITRRHEANRIETCFSKPSVSVIIQGSKRTMLGSEEYCYGENQCLVAGVDMPSSFYVTDASPERPFLALCLDLDKYLITRLAAEVPPPCATGPAPTRGSPSRTLIPISYMRFCASSSFSRNRSRSPYSGRSLSAKSITACSSAPKGNSCAD